MAVIFWLIVLSFLVPWILQNAKKSLIQSIKDEMPKEQTPVAFKNGRVVYKD